jgi:hypothetical protein
MRSTRVICKCASGFPVYLLFYCSNFKQTFAYGLLDPVASNSRHILSRWTLAALLSTYGSWRDNPLKLKRRHQNTAIDEARQISTRNKGNVRRTIGILVPSSGIRTSYRHRGSTASLTITCKIGFPKSTLDSSLLPC